MMWNWQLTALASGVEIVLFDGAIGSADTLWALVARRRVSVFGTSPAYLQLSEDAGLVPRQAFDLSRLRAVLSTGSILYDRQLRLGPPNVGPLPLQSISGGTDIIGCFVLAIPTCRSIAAKASAAASVTTSRPGAGRRCRPVRGSATRVLQPVFRRGRSACSAMRTAAASTPPISARTPPVDPRRLHRIHRRRDGAAARAFRRRDEHPRHPYRSGGNLSRAAGTSRAIREAMAVEQATPAAPATARMVLLVVLQPDRRLDGDLVRTIRRELGRRLSAAHVPEVIADVAALPVTHSGKRSERAAHDALNGKPLRNRDALRNPDCLELIRRHPALTAPVRCGRAGAGRILGGAAAGDLGAAVQSLADRRRR